MEGDQDGVVEVFDDEGLQDREKVLLHRPSFPAPCSTILTAPLAPVARRNSTVLSSNRRLSTSLDRSANRLNARSSILVLTSFIPSTRRCMSPASSSARNERASAREVSASDLRLLTWTRCCSRFASARRTAVASWCACFEELLLEVGDSIPSARELVRAMSRFEREGGAGRSFGGQEGMEDRVEESVGLLGWILVSRGVGGAGGSTRGAVNLDERVGVDGAVRSCWAWRGWRSGGRDPWGRGAWVRLGSSDGGVRVTRTVGRRKRSARAASSAGADLVRTSSCVSEDPVGQPSW